MMTFKIQQCFNHSPCIACWLCHHRKRAKNGVHWGL